MKPNNILVTERRRAKVSDFGECLSSEYHSKPVTLSYNCYYARGFTPPYTAPEVFSKANSWLFHFPYPSPPRESL